MKKHLPFDLEDNPITDDPLQFLLNFTGLVLINKYAKWIRCILFITFIILEIVCVIAIMRYLFGHVSIKTYITTILGFQPMYVGLAFLIVYIKNIGGLQHKVFELSSELNNLADKRFLEKLLYTKKIIIIGSVFIFVEVMTNLILFFPFFWDEEELIYTFKFINEWLQFSYLLFYYAILFLSIIGICYPALIIIYLTFHFKFQCELLYNYFEINVVQFTLAGKNCIEDAGYQREIYRRLKVCAKKHEGLNRFTKSFQPMLCAMILFLGVTSQFSIIGFVYSIAVESSPRSNFRIYYSLMDALMFVVLNCALGQIVTNQSDFLFNILCSCPWYDWDIRNRKVLLMMIREAYIKPFGINFYGIKTVNFPFMLQFLKMSYTFLAVAINFK